MRSSPRSCTCPSTSGWAISSRGRCSGPSRSPSTAGRVRPATGRFPWPICGCRWIAARFACGRRGWASGCSPGSPRRTITRCRGTTSTASSATSRPRGPPHRWVGTGVRCAGYRPCRGSPAAGWCWREPAGRSIPPSCASWPDRPGPRRFRQVQEWRGRRRLPRWIELVEADQLLPIDLDNPLLVDTFVELVKGRDVGGPRGDVPGPR